MPAAKNHPGEWGTEHTPLLMTDVGWEYLHAFLRDRMQHVHLYHGGGDSIECIRNIFGQPCAPHYVGGQS